jgi:CBS domain-containing protein
MTAMMVWLGFINIALAVFNMIPGFPLDGGRVLRAALWWGTGDANRSTRIAARVGQIVAFGFILLGFIRFLTGGGLGGLWLGFIGWFLLEAARASHSQVKIAEELRGVRVSDIMARDCPVIDRQLDIQRFTDEHLLRTGRRCYLVVDGGGVIGLVTPNEIRKVDRSRWPDVTIGDVMRPLAELRTVAPDTPVTEVLETMGRDDVNQLPVVSDHHLEGIITRGHVVRFLQARSELTM